MRVVVSAQQGAREARALVHSIGSGQQAPEALHVALQELRASGDGDRLRGFTREIQSALAAGQNRAPDLRALKDFQDLAARGALHGGLQLYRTDPADGPVRYFTVCHRIARAYPDLQAVRARVQELEGHAAEK